MINLYIQKAGRTSRIKRKPVRRSKPSGTPWGLIAVLFTCMILMIVLLNYMDDQLCAAIEAGDASATRYTEEICNQP